MIFCKAYFFRFAAQTNHVMIIRKFIFTLVFLFPLFSFAQNASVKGTLVNDKNVPIQNAVVELSGTNFNATTDKDGNFEIKNVSLGKYSLLIQDVEFSNFKLDVDVNAVEINFVYWRESMKTQDFKHRKCRHTIVGVQHKRTQMSVISLCRVNKDIAVK